MLKEILEKQTYLLGCENDIATYKDGKQTFIDFFWKN